LNEWEIIAEIKRTIGETERNYSQIGDDVAYFTMEGRKVVVKSDMLVERTDVPRQMTFRQAARKSIVSCVSDFAAKGVRPKAVLLSIGLERGTPDSKILDLIHGFRDAKEEFGTQIIGGDTSETDSLVIDCIMVGDAEQIIPRSGARPGDIILSSGKFGYTSVGMEVLLKSANAPEPLKTRSIQSVLQPAPSLEFGLVAKDYARASTDSSDGLAISLYQLAEGSGVGIDVDSLPVDEQLSAFAREHSLSKNELALYGGEEFHIICALAPGKFDSFSRTARRRKIEFHKIGKANGKRGRVTLKVRGEPAVEIEKRGWTHLG
jgi:thiamine-monophosphate kinase